MKSLKEKVEDILLRQDQSLQILHMLCRPKPYYSELNKVAIGYKNPLCLTRVKQVQPALYNGHEIIKDNHVSAIVHNTEDTLKIAEITRKKMNDKIKDPECVTRKALSKEIKEMKDVFEELEAEVNQNVIDRKHDVKPKVLARGKCAIDVEPIVPRLRNNRDAHLDYLRHLKESVETIHDIVEEAEVVRPLDRSIISACRYTNHSQELLEYVIGVNSFPNASGSQPRSNTKKNRISPAKGVNKMPVEDQPRTNKSYLRTSNRVDSSWSKHMTRDRSRLMNFIKKFIGIVRFGNDHFGAIMGYGDYVIGDSVISRVYYVEGLGHNLFFVGQFCDSDMEVAFRKHSCYVRDTDGVELIKGSRGSNLYTISIEDMLKSSLICLLSKASKNKSWLWHRQPPRIERPVSPATAAQVHVISTGTPSSTTIDQDAPSLSISPSYFALQSQQGVAAEPTFIGNNLIAPVDNTPFINVFALEPSSDASSSGDISSTESTYTVPKTLQHNGVVERQNHTLIEAARIMLIFSKAPMYQWAEAMATACYTQNRYLIHTRHTKTSYELVHNKKPDLTFFRVFGALCYPINDSEDLGKLQPTADIGIFISYAPSRKAGIPSSTTIDQDAPSLSISPSYFALQSQQGVAAEPTFIGNNLIAPVDNTPFINVFALEPSSDASSSGDISST
nr:retrovirus-related Pol polyprotein from transposon TNT 1-94 [Tanacetum cinerariifolium]